MRHEWQELERSPRLKQKSAKVTKKQRNTLKTETESDFKHFRNTFNNSNSLSNDYSLRRATKKVQGAVHTGLPLRLTNQNKASSAADKE